MKNVLSALSLLVLVAGCQPKPAEGPTQAAGAAKVGGDVIATVGTLAISKAQFDAEVSRLPEQSRTWTTTAQGRRHIVDQLVEGALIEQEAARRGLDKKPAVALKLDSLRRQVLREALLDEALPEAPMSDDDAKRYFPEHPDEFRVPEMVKIVEVSVPADQEAKAKEARQKIDKGAAIEQVSREMTKDPFIRERGGDVPEFSRAMRPELFDALAGKKPGTVVGPIKTAMGFHVVKFVKRTPGQERAFAEVKESLKMRQRALKRQQTYLELMKQVREQVKPVLDDAFITGEAAKPAAPAAK